MTTSGARGVDIRPHEDYLEVRGVTPTELHEALDLLTEMRSVQADQTAATRPAIVRALMTTTQIPLVPPASLAQAQRSAASRDALLASGVETYESLAAVRRDALASTTRTWISRRRAAHEVFTVSFEGRTIIPSFQFQDAGSPRAELQPLLAVLAEGGVDPWLRWRWLISASSLLSGDVPDSVARTDPARALRAAIRFAAPRRS